LAEPIVIGIDGGGTTTRAAAADLRGNVLAFAETGGSNPQHAADGEENVGNAIAQVIEGCGRRPEDVAALVAGLAGLDDPRDTEWAERFTSLHGLNCPRVQVNDSVIAHAGALLGEAGIIAVGGTGSIVLGVTETGRQVRNYDFANYSRTASSYLAYDTLFYILVGDFSALDASLVEAMIRHWGARDLKELKQIVSGFSDLDRQARNYRAGELGPLVTSAAMDGSTLARNVCNEAAHQMALAIRLVGTTFEVESVPVVFIGSAIRSQYLSEAIRRILATSSSPRYEVRDPILSATAGALLMALARAGVASDADLISKLRESWDILMDSRPAR
jgi:glucosamine kinase